MVSAGSEGAAGSLPYRLANQALWAVNKTLHWLDGTASRRYGWCVLAVRLAGWPAGWLYVLNMSTRRRARSPVRPPPLLPPLLPQGPLHAGLLCACGVRGALPGARSAGGGAARGAGGGLRAHRWVPCGRQPRRAAKTAVSSAPAVAAVHSATLAHPASYLCILCPLVALVAGHTCRPLHTAGRSAHCPSQHTSHHPSAYPHHAALRCSVQAPTPSSSPPPESTGLTATA